MNQTDFDIIRCNACGTKNRIPLVRDPKTAVCGKCGQPLKSEKKPSDSAALFTLRCLNCRAKNKIPAAKIEDNPKCGKCGDRLKTEELFIKQPVIVTDGNFDQAVIGSPLPVLVFAWATWCPSCGAYAPVIDEFARDAKGKIRVVKMNVDASQMIASKYSILSVPFLFIFDNGQMKENFPGGLPKHELMMKMAPYL